MWGRFGLFSTSALVHSPPIWKSDDKRLKLFGLFTNWHHYTLLVNLVCSVDVIWETEEFVEEVVRT